MIISAIKHRRHAAQRVVFRPMNFATMPFHLSQLPRKNLVKKRDVGEKWDGYLLKQHQQKHRVSLMKK
jgi:hypothetical protein